MMMSSFNFLVSSLSVKTGRDRKTSSETVRIKIRLTMYIFVFVLFHIFEITRKIHTLTDPQNPNFALYVLARVFTPLNGLGNAVVYGLNRGVVNAYRKICCNCIGKSESSSVIYNDNPNKETNMNDEYDNQQNKFSTVLIKNSFDGVENMHPKARNSWAMHG